MKLPVKYHKQYQNGSDLDYRQAKTFNKMPVENLVELTNGFIETRKMYIRQLREASQKKKEYDSIMHHFKKHIGQCDKVIELAFKRLAKEMQK